MAPWAGPGLLQSPPQVDAKQQCRPEPALPRKSLKFLGAAQTGPQWMVVALDAHTRYAGAVHRKGVDYPSFLLFTK